MFSFSIFYAHRRNLLSKCLVELFLRDFHFGFVCLSYKQEQASCSSNFQAFLFFSMPLELLYRILFANLPLLFLSNSAGISCSLCFCCFSNYAGPPLFLIHSGVNASVVYNLFPLVAGLYHIPFPVYSIGRKKFFHVINLSSPVTSCPSLSFL